MIYRLKELREERNMSQEELSQKSGVSRQIISILESENREVNTTTATLQKLSAALNCSLSEIFCLNRLVYKTILTNNRKRGEEKWNSNLKTRKLKN